MLSGYRYDQLGAIVGNADIGLMVVPMMLAALECIVGRGGVDFRGEHRPGKPGQLRCERGKIVDRSSKAASSGKDSE